MVNRLAAMFPQDRLILPQTQAIGSKLAGAPTRKNGGRGKNGKHDSKAIGSYTHSESLSAPFPEISEASVKSLTNFAMF